MSSQQSSFRQMYDYPQEGQDQRQRKYALKGIRNRKVNFQGNKQKKDTFFDIVQKAKNVAMFAQTLKQRISQKRTLFMHTLKQSEMQFLQNDSRAEEKKTIFKYGNKAILLVQMVFTSALLLYLWKSTYQSVFGQTQGRLLITAVTLVMYLLHIAAFNLTQYKNQKQQLISNRLQIAQIYLKQKLVKDLIVVSTIVVQMLPITPQNSQWLFVLVRVISLFAWFQLSETIQKVQNFLSISNQAQILISMLKLLFKVFLFLHFLSIILNLFAMIQNFNGVQTTWLNNSNLSYDTNMEKYIIGWYWGATILSTVGFGQITPSNNYQRFFISIVQVTCCMTFGYFVNVIGALIKVQGESDQKYQKDIRTMNRCMNFVSITNELEHKIRTHYFNKHIIEKMHDPNQEKELLSNLTPVLKTAVFQQNNINILKKSLVMQKFRPQLLIKLTHVLKRIIYAPQHILYSRNTRDRKLWFIESGRIEQYTNNFQRSQLRKMISVYNQSDRTVGWYNFLTKNGYNTMGKVKIFTVAYELEQEGFLRIIAEDKKDYHKYLQLKQLMIEKDRKYVPKCLSCDRYTHNVINCPRIHFVRKDIKKVALQNKQLNSYVNDVKKKKKLERNMIRYCWKKLYGTGELQKQAKLLTSNESMRLEGGTTMENFFKNFALRESVIGFERRKMSHLVPKKISKVQSSYENKDSKQPKDGPKDITQTNSNNLSIASCDVIEEQEQQIFQKVFFNKQNKDYMPQHDVEEILSNYAKRYLKSRIIATRMALMQRK